MNYRTKTNINLFHRWYDKVSDIVKVDFTDKIQVSDNENYIISSSLLKNNSVFSTIIKNEYFSCVAKFTFVIFYGRF